MALRICYRYNDHNYFLTGLSGYRQIKFSKGARAKNMLEWENETSLLTFVKNKQDDIKAALDRLLANNTGNYVIRLLIDDNNSGYYNSDIKKWISNMEKVTIYTNLDEVEEVFNELADAFEEEDGDPNKMHISEVTFNSSGILEFNDIN